MNWFAMLFVLLGGGLVAGGFVGGFYVGRNQVVLPSSSGVKPKVRKPRWNPSEALEPLSPVTPAEQREERQKPKGRVDKED